MAVRWVICPVIGDGVMMPRRPLVADMADPGRPGKTYSHASVISDGLPGQVNDWCLSQVWGVDFSPLDADARIKPVFEASEDHDHGEAARGAFLGSTPHGRGWTAGKLARIGAALSARGLETADVTLDTPLADVLTRIGQRINPQFDPRRERTSVR